MTRDRWTAGRPALVALLSAIALAASCDPADEQGTLVFARQAENVLAVSGHPALDSLPRQAAQSGPCIDPHAPAVDGSGSTLASAAASKVPTGMRLASEGGGLGWVIYAVSDEEAPSRFQAIQLDFAELSEGAWLALADAERGSWQWQELPASPRVEVSLDAERNFRADGTLFLTLAVCDGNAMIFTGGELLEQAEEDTEPPAPDPAEKPDGETLDIVGVYLSLGYWQHGLVDETFAELASLGVNFVIDYALEPPTEEYGEAGLKRYLDLASQLGIGVAFPLYPELAGMTPVEPDGHIDAAITRVRALRAHPGITAWYVHDEILPWVAGEAGTTKYSLSLAQMKLLYDAVHAEDPTRPQISVWHFLPTYNQFHLVYGDGFLPYGRPAWMDDPQTFEQAMQELVQHTCDWPLVDMYPIGAPWDDAEGMSPAAHVAALTQRASALKAEHQPLRFVFQAFSWAQYDPVAAADAPFPGREQMELMLAAAHQEGAMGAVAYSWFDLTGDLPGRDITGRREALAELKEVLAALATTGWPVGGPLEAPVTPTLPPPVVGLPPPEDS